MDSPDAKSAIGTNGQINSQAPSASGIAATGATTQGAATTMPAKDPVIPDLRTSPLLTAGKTYMDLMNGQSELDTSAIQPSMVSEIDPRSILTVNAQWKKALHITDFLMKATKRRHQSRWKEVMLSQRMDDRVMLQTDYRHPYSGISIREWGAANCPLINALLLENCELRWEDVEYYLAYSTQIFEYSVNVSYLGLLQLLGEVQFRHLEQLYPNTEQNNAKR